MNRLTVALAALAAAALGAYGASPFWAVHELREAARLGDQEKLEAHVDFPAVRDSIKSQLNSALAARMKTLNDDADNPFAALGAALAPVIVDKAVDAYVTPDAIAAMVKDAAPPRANEQAGDNQGEGAGQGEGKGEPPARETAATSVSYGYASLDRFKATFTNADKPQEPLVMTMERRGMFGWKLVRIDLPLTDDEVEPPAPAANAKQQDG